MKDPFAVRIEIAGYRDGAEQNIIIQSLPFKLRKRTGLKIPVSEIEQHGWIGCMTASLESGNSPHLLGRIRASRSASFGGSFFRLDAIKEKIVFCYIESGTWLTYDETFLNEKLVCRRDGIARALQRPSKIPDRGKPGSRRVETADDPLDDLFVYLLIERRSGRFVQT